MANEKRLIELDNALLVTVGESFPRPLPEHDEVLLATVRKKLRNLPYVDAVEVVHGQWEDMYGGKYENPRFRCSVCKRKALYVPVQGMLGAWSDTQALSKYCPNCGAKMDGERKDND